MNKAFQMIRNEEQKSLDTVINTEDRKRRFKCR